MGKCVTLESFLNGGVGATSSPSVPLLPLLPRFMGLYGKQDWSLEDGTSPAASYITNTATNEQQLSLRFPPFLVIHVPAPEIRTRTNVYLDGKQTNNQNKVNPSQKNYLLLFEKLASKTTGYCTPLTFTIQE